MDMQPIRLGLIGLGKIARDQHLPALLVDSRYALAAIVDPAGVAMPDIPGFASLDALLADGPPIDAVSLCTPPCVRAELAEVAVRAGKHVLLEKPPVASPGELETLTAAARDAGVALYASWHSRESRVVDTARDWLKSRTIRSASIAWLEDIRQWHPGQDWLLARGGFGVFDPAINAFSILTVLLGEPVAVAEAELAIPGNRAAPVTARARMKSATGAPVSADLSILHRGEQRWDIVVETDDGRLELTRGGHRMAVNGQPVLEIGDCEYPRIYDRFARLVAAREIDADSAPLDLVSACLSQGRITRCDNFEF